MVVQAAAAEQMLQSDPPRAREPISQIQDSGRQAVLELRRLLGILRPEEDETSLAPHPTLRDLPAMPDRARDAGLSVELEIRGAQRDLAPSVELTAYRLVQEALTNALKHAGPTRARVVASRRRSRAGSPRCPTTAMSGCASMIMRNPARPGRRAGLRVGARAAGSLTRPRRQDCVASAMRAWASVRTRPQMRARGGR